jgi:hypothetical protein
MEEEQKMSLIEFIFLDEGDQKLEKILLIELQMILPSLGGQDRGDVFS